MLISKPVFSFASQRIRIYLIRILFRFLVLLMLLYWQPYLSSMQSHSSTSSLLVFLTNEWFDRTTYSTDTADCMLQIASWSRWGAGQGGLVWFGPKVGSAEPLRCGRTSFFPVCTEFWSAPSLHQIICRQLVEPYWCNEIGMILVMNSILFWECGGQLSR